MYSLYCPTLGSETILDSDAILSLHKTSRGTTGYFRCACGAVGVMTVGMLDIEPVLHHPVGTTAAQRERVTATTAA